jgi:predicted transposase YbfD/YdcC
MLDEEDNIIPLLLEIQKELAENRIDKFEIIVVDDGSADSSASKVSEHLQKYPYIRLIRLRRRFGQTAAMAAGIDHSHGKAIVTIDAMGCQTKVVEKIIEKEADYVIGLKGNQGNLQDDVKTFFEKKPKNRLFSQSTEVDKGHGRLETRICTVTDDIDWLKERHPEWKKLKTVIEIESIREIKGEVSVEKRYYIASIVADTTLAQRAVRQHWGVESLHWVLDISFGDDQSRIRKGNAPRNMAIVKKTVLNLLQIVKKSMSRITLKRMRKLAGWNGDFLDTILAAKF